jgi:uncharacterized protein DUF6289
MKRNLKVRFGVALFAAGVGVLSYLSLLPEPKAMPSPGVCTYYSSSKFKTVVGQRGTGCCGEIISWGEVTAFRRCEQVWCLDVWCPGEEI